MPLARNFSQHDGVENAAATAKMNEMNDLGFDVQRIGADGRVIVTEHDIRHHKHPTAEEERRAGMVYVLAVFQAAFVCDFGCGMDVHLFCFI